MRHPGVFGLCLLGAAILSGCGQQQQRAAIEKEVNNISESDKASLDAIELTVADPTEAVAYFSKAVQKFPDRTDQKRYLAMSLMRASRPADAAKMWQEVTAAPDAKPGDSVSYADALIQSGNWKLAETVLNGVNPTYETYDRYRLEAMIADSKKEWKKADSFYETAVGLTTTPAGIYNNWGFSKLTRHDYAGAEQLFDQALTYDPNLFIAKNNLILARAGQHKYDMPVIQMTQREKAQLLYTLALAAVKQGDVEIGKSLLHEAIDTNPEYFEAAQRSLSALEANGTH